VQAVLDLLASVRPSVLVLQPASLDEPLGETLAAAGFTRAPIDVVPAATVEVDLARQPDEIMAAMRSSRRRNIRKAERAGLEVRRGGDADIAMFRELHALTAERQGFVPMSLDYLLRQWEVLSPSGALRLYIADLEGEALSAATVSAFGDRMVFRLAGLSENPAARETRASDYLHWRVLCEARDEGFAFYDLGGFDRDAASIIENGEQPPEHVRASASQFKLGFGGDVRTLPQAVWRLAPGPARILQRPAAALFNRVPRLRGFVSRTRAG
jgi:lipid II:glycine glycyltransferase (peptidoglycan interpeptide bridge formation enzyme)